MSANQASAKVQDIEWGIVEGENTEFAIQYPRMQWSHGEAKSSGWMKTGGLFISANQYPNFKADGFEPTKLITDDGTEIDGYAATQANLAVIRVKHQWIHDEKYNRNVPLAQALVAVKGCEDLICISLKGATKALEFQKAFNQHISQNVAVANRNRPAGAAAIEPFALWFILKAGAARKVSGKDSDKSSSVTPPELVVPEAINHEYVRTLWVGGPNYKAFAGFWKETSVWQKVPIWEQRDNDRTELETTGGDGTQITQSQVEMIFGIIEAKKLIADEVREMCELASNGATTSIAALTRDEATSLIDTVKAL